MTKRPAVVFIHGWQGNENSYGELPRLLHKAGWSVDQLYLGRYRTADDQLNIDDYAIRLEEIIRQPDRIATPFDVITHSTGALVVRRWLSKYYAPDQTSPVGKFLMVAPANNGSRLASWCQKLPWRWGNEIIPSLRLGSSFTWQLNWHWLREQYHRRMKGLKVYLLLATKNRLKIPIDTDWLDNTYGIDLPFFQEPGSDTVVRFCSANLNMKGVRLGVGEKINTAEIYEINEVPIYIFNRRNHFGERDGILASIRREKDQVFQTILSILDDRDAPPTPKQKYPKTLNHSMLNIRVVDQLGNSCPHFIPHFYFGDKSEQRSQKIQIQHRSENEDIQCFYLKYRDFDHINKFGFRIMPNTIGSSQYAPSNCIDLLWRNSEHRIEFLTEHRTHFIEVAVEKTISKYAMDLKQFGS